MTFVARLRVLLACELILVGGLLFGGVQNVTAQQRESLPLPARNNPAMNGQNPVVNRLPPPTNGQELTIRIKDITSIEGHRSNKVWGYGLVTGLKGTGGKSDATKDAVANFYRSMGFQPKSIPTGSVALVVVNASIPPSYHPGEELSNVSVSVMDDATGLFGGVLQMTHLKGIDGKTYALASGPVRVSGFSASGAGASITKNHDTSGKVTAQVEVTLRKGPAYPENFYWLLLRNKDYTTAARVASRINQEFPGHARAFDQGSIKVYFPNRYRDQKHSVVAFVNNLRVTPDTPARVVINQKTGTIVFGHNVRLTNLMFAHGNLIITTNEAPVASQPAPFSDGETAILDRTSITAVETGGRFNVLNQTTTVGDLAATLNLLGILPQDLIVIFQSFESAGQLQAELIIE